MSNLLEQASLVMIPSGYKEDIVYSEIPINGSGDLQFTRSSNGTRINSAGLVEVCPWNLLSNSEQFTSANGWFPNITGSSTATQTSDYGVAPNGTTTADRIQLALNGSSFADWVVVPTTGIIVGQVYTYSIYIKSLSGTKTILFFNDSTVNVSKTITTEWVRYEYSWTATSTTIYPRFLIDGGTSSSVDLLAWGYQLNIGSTAKPYFPTTDRLNVPRLTYQNGGGGCPSLLLEKQSTNLNTYSNDFTNGWAQSGGTITATANYGISPDGTQNSTRLQFSAGNLIWRKTITGLVGNVGTWSLYIKGTAGETIAITYGGVDLLVTLASGWNRYSVTATATLDEVFVTTFLSATARNLEVWGGQCELSSYATSLIYTTSSSATRVADACFKTGISSLIGQTEGTIFVDINNQLVNPPLDTRIQLSDGSTNNWIFLGVPDGGTGGLVRCYVLNVATSFNMSFYSSSALAQQRYKIAFAYKSGSFALYINGVLEGSSSATGTMPSCSALAIGGSTPTSITQDSIQQFNEVILFPTRLTNAELASLTTI